jgi:hypothetical protein
MARKSLRPHLNQIRSWVRQGRTDAWVAHQLEVPVQDIAEFKRHNELMSDNELGESGAGDYLEEIDLRAEDDALVAAELEAAALEAERERVLEEERAEAEKEERERRKQERAESDDEDKDEDEEDDEEEEQAPRRRRSRRGGRGRKAGSRSGSPLEGTFDHGEEGYGLWLDPAIQDDPVYAEHWACHRPIEVVVEEEQIVIRRAREDS